MVKQTFCVIDFETYSEAPLKRTGAFEYSVHPSTEILCVAWRIGTRDTLRDAPTKVWSSKLPSSSIQELLAAFANPAVTLVAHNALFEQVITRNVLSRQLHTQVYLRSIPPSRWVCTASLAAALALPRNLEGAALALNLPVQKDMDGNRLIKKWCKPRKPTKHNPSTRHDDPEELKRLMQYCATDVAAEVELFLRVPPLTRMERKVWELDQEINLRGFLVDRPLVKTTLTMIADEVRNLNRETYGLTGGAVSTTKKVAAVNAWLADHGITLPNLQKKTVEDTLRVLPEGRPKRLLEIRAAVSKTSTAKYKAFEMRSRHDSRTRDILVYHAASTGRWGGAGVQPQNLKRSSLKDTDTATGIVSSGDLELIRMVYGDPMEVFSSCLRSVIIAPKGRVLDVADYAAIEARVLFWVAGHEIGLGAFREGRDLYKEQAAKIFNCKTEDVSSTQRFVGKQVILGAGFGMGPPKFEAHCASQGQVVSRGLAEAAISAYRSTNKPVVALWSNLNRAAMAATQNPGKTYKINRTKWSVSDGFLWCELPSGRRLAYYGPEVRYERNRWGEKRPALYHWGVDSLSKKWVFDHTYGGKISENVVSAIARDIMAEAMLRIAATKTWDLVLTVHDELVAERLEWRSSVAEFIKLMERLPIWAPGLPVKVEGWSGLRYRK